VPADDELDDEDEEKPSKSKQQVVVSKKKSGKSAIKEQRLKTEKVGENQVDNNSNTKSTQLTLRNNTTQHNTS
jgi:hypothetical protein